jgi:hypothetical protein
MVAPFSGSVPGACRRIRGQGLDLWPGLLQATLLGHERNPCVCCIAISVAIWGCSGSGHTHSPRLAPAFRTSPQKCGCWCVR